MKSNMKAPQKIKNKAIFNIYTYAHKGILLSHKKNKIVPFVTTWMNLESIVLSEIS